MRLLERAWVTVTYIANYFTFPGFEPTDSSFQSPLGIPHRPPHVGPGKGPRFKPPGGAPTGDGSDFKCDYSAMPGFEPCFTGTDRSCWLRNEKTGKEYNINTNYELVEETPIGVHRTYYLNLTDVDKLNADGLNFPYAKLFNGSYPGPWIQGCWGDNITVVVENSLGHNGTSVHWHGIRQLESMHMDGVNGVTQCPIAPGDKFNYTFRALQYGSSWYHSHYSVQYADGTAGPLTLHGPSSAAYDEPKRPIIMTDWGHNSAFEAIFNGLKNPGILLNGIGNVTRYNNSVKSDTIPEPYTLRFDRPTPRKIKKYLLRLINTSFDSTFVFSIDNHMLQIVQSDFVPIVPYRNTSVLVGIGQRYHVIVEANPVANARGPPPRDGNFWIRTRKAECFGFVNPENAPTPLPARTTTASLHYEKAGILRYSDSKALPTSSEWEGVSVRCSDETYSSLKPVLPWTVGQAANVQSNEVGEILTVQFQAAPAIYPLALAAIGHETPFTPLLISYENPAFLNLENTGPWDPLWTVFNESSKDEWVYLVMKGKGGNTFGAHPIHLHGHDFAILQEMENATFGPDTINLKKDNPPRRDVVLLPNNGFVVMAFKTDNPGSWLMHCHIAFHASFGLALQIMERREDAAALWPSKPGAVSPAIKMIREGCDRWNEWWEDCDNWWQFPEDSERPRGSCHRGSIWAAPDSGI